MSKILVGSTIPAFKMAADWDWWLTNAEQITASAVDAGHEVDWLVVCQEDARGSAPFAPLERRLGELDVAGLSIDAWSFSLDTGERAVSTGSRLIAICTGRNLIVERANRRGHDWVYFADADISAPDDVLVRLLEVRHPVVGANVPTYCLGGPRVSGEPDRPDIAAMNLQKHWNTAGSLLVAREVFRRVPWRYDLDAGLTDDPATQGEMERLGWPTLVRHDVECVHHPAAIGPLEERRHDLRVYR